MQSQEINQVKFLLTAMQQGADNEARKQGEENIKTLRSGHAKLLLKSFCEIIFQQGAS